MLTLTTDRRDHAIVIGASLAGLAAARALSERFDHVTLLERCEAPAGATSIAPHGRLPHVLLPGGAQALERLLPGFHEELFTAGAVVGTGRNGRWWSDGWRQRYDAAVVAPMATRGLIESVVRRRVLALPNVRVEYGARVGGVLVCAGRVTGARTERDGRLPADLVVDCSGRGSDAARWLEEAGFQAPEASEVGVDLQYTSFTLRRAPGQLDGDLYAVVQNIPPATRLGLAIAVEGDRWLVFLGGYFGDRAPTDPAGAGAFAESLPVPDLAELLAAGEPAAEPCRYRYRASRRLHFERLRCIPAGLVVMGDAMCSFNPLYGQGMSVAALQAERLGACLDRVRDPAALSRVAARQLARIADQAWQIAAGADFAYARTIGAKPRGTDLVNRHVARVMRACTVDERVSHAMSQVQNLLAPPSSLLRPSIVARTLLAQRRWARQTAAPAAALSPARA
jgi:2-polyprenyl-6-methoxyphenol hydroxylase-like FAD-dependent oxidoreductase